MIEMRTAGVERAGRTRSRAARIAIGVAVTLMVSVVAAFAVWVAGLDAAWAVATVVAVGAVGAVLATLPAETDVAWEWPERDPPRGVRLTMPTLEASLAACDRLARPRIVRRLRALVIDEREDLMARATLVRRVRALLVAELRARGGARRGAHTPPSDDALLALLGPDAHALLQPDDERPVTSAAIARYLDVVDRLASERFASERLASERLASERLASERLASEPPPSR